MHGLRVKLQEAGCGVRYSLPRCRKQGGGLLHAEPEEGGIVGRRKLQADLAIDHGHGFRVHGEGCEGVEIGELVTTPEWGGKLR